MKKILFISRKAERCGVADYGKRVNTILQNSKSFQTVWTEIENAADYITAFEKHQPDLVLYNYYPTILSFINDEFLSDKRHIPHIALYHEVGLAFTPTAIIDVDSTLPDNIDTLHFSVPRPLFDNFKNDDSLPNNDIPTIGTFGFGFKDKNFPKLAQLVCDQFSHAKIRVNMPYATFGDADGQSARFEVAQMQQGPDTYLRTREQRQN